jgi:diguanylate cyclase (GGDEF)-like protein/PAS domain S-box-containing protein
VSERKQKKIQKSKAEPVQVRSRLSAQGGEGVGLAERVANEGFDLLLDNLPVGVYRVEPGLEGRVIYANLPLVRMLGYDSREELQAASPAYLRFDSVEPGSAANMVSSLSGEISLCKRLERKNGESVWVGLSARTVRDCSGVVAYHEGVVEDITPGIRAETARGEAEAKYRSIFQHAPVGIFQTTPDGLPLDVNPEFARIFGYDSSAEFLRAVTDIARQLYVDPTDRDRFKESLETKGWVADFEACYRRKDGSEFWATLNAGSVKDMEGRVLCYDGFLVDVTERKEAEERLAGMNLYLDREVKERTREITRKAGELELAHLQVKKALAAREAHFRQLFDNSPLAVAFLDAAGEIIEVNKSFSQLFGFSEEELRSSKDLEPIFIQGSEAEGRHVRCRVLEGDAVRLETVRQHKDGGHVPVALSGYPVGSDGVRSGVFYCFEDISERKRNEQELTLRAFHDSLTGLPNRNLFLERLTHALRRFTRRAEYRFAVLVLDVNRFKRIKDQLGHKGANEFLEELGGRLGRCVRTVDTAARLGWDVFGVILEEVEDSAEALGVVDRIRTEMDAPFRSSGSDIHAVVGLGLVLETQGYSNAEEVLRDAEIAVALAKELSEPLVVFEPAMRQRVQETSRLETELRRAVKEREFILHYQPIFSVETKAVCGFESLVRWSHPTLGLLSPDQFIPLAKETGLIVPLGEWVVMEACRQGAAWRNSIPGLNGLTMSVNISCKQFLQPGLADFVQGVLRDTGFPPELLRLELTETVLMREADAATENMECLKGHGVRLAIDDFGTGYSSLGYLRRFPIDQLKIDRTFMSGNGQGDENLAIVRTIVHLARDLGMGVVAEGVEREDQLADLRQLECGLAQGYLFSRPVNAESATQLLKNFVEDQEGQGEVSEQNLQ